MFSRSLSVAARSTGLRGATSFSSGTSLQGMHTVAYSAPRAVSTITP